MSDESLREFQLNGKQLVFLFMASTIVAVVVFLCGVMVGRGAGAAQALVATRSTADAGDPTEGEVPAPVAAQPSTPVDVPPVVPGDDPDLKYPTSLTTENPKPDLEPATVPSKPVAPQATALGDGTARAAASSAAAASTPSPGNAPAERETSTEPSGTGFVVQVAATARRAEAEAIRGRLQSKGYPVFVTTSGKLFRVRVGKYKDRAEATTVSKRLQTEERFKPWVTR